MPIYEYRCLNGHQFEVMQRFSDAPIERCAECGASVQKVLSSPAIHFKGSGFHNTDYGRGKAGRPADGDGGGSSGGETTKGSGGDSASTTTTTPSTSGSEG